MPETDAVGAGDVIMYPDDTEGSVSQNRANI